MVKGLLVILGQTATGKTDLAIKLAKQFDAEVVSADSRQVYVGLDVGTGKTPGDGGLVSEKGLGFWRFDSIKIWGYDLVSPKIRLSAKDFVDFAGPKIDEITRSGKNVILVGGTGLYIKLLLEGMDYSENQFDENKRAELERLSLTDLQRNLKNLDSESWESLNESDQVNKRRLIRRLEMAFEKANGDVPKKLTGLNQKYPVLKIGLTAPKKILDQRIDLRVQSWIEQGLIQEGERLHVGGLSFERMREIGLIYGILADLLEGRINRLEFESQLKIKNHQYAARQMTWFKRDPEINWVDVSTADYLVKVVSLISDWYNTQEV